MSILLDKEKRDALITELLEVYVKEFLLTELDIRGVDKQFATQRNTNFKSHAKTVADLKSKGIYPEFIDFGNGIAAFSIKSSEWKMGHGMSNNEYTMAIRFYEWPKFYDDPQLNLVQRVNNLGKGNIGIMCSCPSFQYNYGYQTNIKKSEFYDEEHRNYWHTMPAPITNPSNVGIGCKHLALLLNPYTYKLDVLPEVYRAIQDKMPNQGPGASPSAPNSKRNGISEAIENNMQYHIDEEILFEGLGNGTKQITQTLCNFIIKCLKTTKYTGQDMNGYFLLDIKNDVNPQLAIIDRIKDQNNLKLKIHLHLIAGTRLVTPHAETDFENNEIKFDIFYDKNKEVQEITNRTLAKLYAIVEHEIRHWYQHNISLDPTMKTPDYIDDYINDDWERYKIKWLLLSPQEIDSYLRGWLSELKKLNIKKKHFQKEWTVFLYNKYKLVLRVLKDENKSLDVINNQFAPKILLALRHIKEDLALLIDNNTLSFNDISAFDKQKLV